jgi:cytochrome c5
MKSILNSRALLLSAFAMIILSACKVSSITPSQQDVDRVSSRFPGYTLASLNEGKMLFETKCSKCHNAKKPQSRTEAQWKKIVPRMTQMANKKTENITPENQEAILKYLITMAKPGEK